MDILCRGKQRTKTYTTHRFEIHNYFIRFETGMFKRSLFSDVQKKREELTNAKMVAGMLSLPDEEAKGLHRHMGDQKRQFLSIHCVQQTQREFSRCSF